MERVDKGTKSIANKYMNCCDTLNKANILSSCDTDDVEERKELVSSLFTGKYPRQTWDMWVFDDKDGIVYGWPDTITLYIVGEGKKIFAVEVSVSFTAAQFCILQRKVILYQRKTGRMIRKVVVYTAMLEEELFVSLNEKVDYDIVGRLLSPAAVTT